LIELLKEGGSEDLMEAYVFYLLSIEFNLLFYKYGIQRNSMTLEFQKEFLRVISDDIVIIIEKFSGL